ncbi:hypothetical protein [Mycolicibacterium aubagnense]|nr:hypothetical protein [Mycolicibacterium aubagnense]TLH64442.1 hypothetical protein C1S80_12215 [Mycolicibacterium aubagnense]
MTFDEVEILDSGALRASNYMVFKHDNSRWGLGETLAVYYPAHAWSRIESLEPKVYTLWVSDQIEGDGPLWETVETCVSAKEAEALALSHIRRMLNTDDDAAAVQQAFDEGLSYRADDGDKTLRFFLARLPEVAQPAG